MSSRVALALLLLSLSTGCIGLPGSELPTRTVAEIVPRGRVAVDYDVTATQWANNSPDFGNQFTERLQKVVGQSGALGKFAKGRGEPYHLRISLDDTFNEGVSSFFCGLTLLVLPGFNTNHYTLGVTLEHDGQAVKSWRYEDSVTTVVEILLIFAAPFKSVGKAVDTTLDNMIRNFLYDLVNERGIEDAGPPASHPQEGAAPSATPTNAPPPAGDR